MTSSAERERSLTGVELPAAEDAPAALSPGNAQAPRAASFETLDGHDAGRLDGAAGGEFLDDRIRLRE